MVGNVHLCKYLIWGNLVFQVLSRIFQVSFRRKIQVMDNPAARKFR